VRYERVDAEPRRDRDALPGQVLVGDDQVDGAMAAAQFGEQPGTGRDVGTGIEHDDVRPA
jgi:hypothetical protein